MCGVVVSGGEYFVVTPYNDYIANPPLGTQRVRICTDGRYDWSVWLQVFSKTLCHFTCIPRAFDNSPWQSLWLLPAAEEFELETTIGIIGGLGKLKWCIFQEIETTVVTVLRQSNQFIPNHMNSTEVKLAIQLGNTIKLWLNWLQYLTTTFCQMVNNCTTLQHLSLELIGLMSYCETYKPIMMGSVPSPGKGHAHELMGAFVTSLWDAERLHQARIPFWFVHPTCDLL